MTPIPFDLPRRILPPTTAYATGLVCEHRPDLADGVRSAVLGDAAMTALDVLTLARVEAGDEQGANALSYLREVVHYGGNAPKDLHGLADVLGLIPRRTAEMKITTGDGDPTIGDNYFTPESGHAVCGLGAGPWAYAHAPDHVETLQAEEGACVLVNYLAHGWDAALALVTGDGEREALRRLIPLHAHTVSLDADARAAWAKAHLGALAEPARPMSPDRLN